MPDIETRKNWWMLCYAITAMQKSAATAHQIAALCQSNRDPLFLPLAVVVHSFYAQPFMKNNGAGRIEEKVVPPICVGIHRWLMNFRCRAYCHADVANMEDTDELWSEVVYEIEGGIKEIRTKTPFAGIETYIAAIQHFESMERVFRDQLDSLHVAHSGLIPQQNGYYALRIDAPSDRLFVPYIPRQDVELRFKGRT